MMKINNNAFRTICCEKGLTIAEVASKADVAEKTVYANLSNPCRRGRFRTIWSLAKALGVDMQDFAEEGRSLQGASKGD